MAFTGNQDLDTLILLELEDPDLENVYSIQNRLIQELFHREEFWRLKAGDKFIDFVKEHRWYENQSYFYFYIHRIAEDELEKELEDIEYKETKKQKRRTYSQIAEKAGVYFPIGMTRRRLNEKCEAVTSGAIYMANVLEYLTVEVFDVIPRNISYIKPETLIQAIQNDDELNRLNNHNKIVLH